MTPSPTLVADPTARDLWLLSRALVGQPPDPAEYRSRSAILAAFAIGTANGRGPHDALDSYLRTALAPTEAERWRQAIAAADPACEPSETGTPRYTVHWAAEALEPQPPMSWSVESHASAGSVGMVVGPPATIKTYSMLDQLVHVALGLPWLGFPVQQGTTLIIDEESGQRRLRRRLAEVMRAHDAPADMPLAYVSLAGFNLRDSEDIAHVDRLVSDLRPSIVLIDALVDVMPGGDENAVSDTQPVMLAARRIAEAYETHVQFIHHANRAGGYRGSSAIPAALDVMLKVERSKTGPELTFTTEKTRDGDNFMYTATPIFNTEAGTFDLLRSEAAAAPLRFSKPESYVIRYLTARGQAWLADIEENADACSASAAKKAVYALVDRGVVKRCDGGGSGSKAKYELVDFANAHMLGLMLAR